MKVSVLMTVYNGEAQLRKSIEGILNQTYKDFEFIIVNDGSNDNSLNIIREYEKQDNRILLLDLKKNCGRIVALNKGLEACNTKFVFINDADDVSYPQRIETQLDFYEKMKKKEKIGVIGSASKFIYSIENREQLYSVKYGSLNKKRIPTWRIYFGMPFIHSSFLYNKEALDSIGGFPTGVSSGIDYFALLKIAVSGYNIYAVRECLVDRIVDGNNFFMKKKIMDKKVKNGAYIDEWKKENIKGGIFLDKLQKLKRKIQKRNY